MKITARIFQWVAVAIFLLGLLGFIGLQAGVGIHLQTFLAQFASLAWNGIVFG